MPVKVSGFKQQIDAAEWIITTLTHSLSADSGYTTNIELEVKIEDSSLQ
jgi:phage protein D